MANESKGSELTVVDSWPDLVRGRRQVGAPLVVTRLPTGWLFGAIISDESPTGGEYRRRWKLFL